MPSNYDLELYKGDYLPFIVNFKNPDGSAMDLTGFEGRAQIRDAVDTTIVYEFDVTVNAPIGQVVLTLPSSTSNQIAVGAYIWDFQLTDPSLNVRTFLAGDVKVYDEVTR